MKKRKWNRVQYHHLQLVGKRIPKDGAWSVWKDSKGNIEVARFKYDAEDHFFPPTKKIKEENIVAWRELRKNKALADAEKTAINSVYGLTSAKFKFEFDSERYASALDKACAALKNLSNALNKI